MKDIGFTDQLKQMCLTHPPVQYLHTYTPYPTSIYLLKVNNTNNRTMCEICSKLTRKTPERRKQR